MFGLNRIFVVMTIFAFGFFHAQDEVLSENSVTDRLSISGPIDFNGTEFFLSWSKQNSKTLTLQQFLPRDERIEDFQQLLNFSYFNKDIDLEEAVKSKITSVQKSIEDDKFGTVNVIESPDGKEFIVDYTISSSEDLKETFIEYNVYRFKKYESENKPLLILSYSKRIYDDLKPSAKALSRQRDALLTQLIEYKIPSITVINQEVENKN